MKRTIVKRFWMIWLSSQSELRSNWRGSDNGLYRWKERLWARRPKRLSAMLRHYPLRFVDLKTGEVIADNFDIREATHIAVTRWPHREKGLRDLAALARKLVPKPKPDPLLKLHADEARWQRKLKLAQTKLRKIRQRIRRREHAAALRPGG